MLHILAMTTSLSVDFTCGYKKWYTHQGQQQWLMFRVINHLQFYTCVHCVLFLPPISSNNAIVVNWTVQSNGL